MARIISLVGSPPQDMLKRGSRSSQYFDDDGRLVRHEPENCLAHPQTGQFKSSDLIPQPGGFENKLTVLEETEKSAFIAFISKMLKWRPEERSTAAELLSDPWLKGQIYNLYHLGKRIYKKHLFHVPGTSRAIIPSWIPPSNIVMAIHSVNESFYNNLIYRYNKPSRHQCPREPSAHYL